MLRLEGLFVLTRPWYCSIGRGLRSADARFDLSCSQGIACNVGDGVGKACESANETVGGAWEQVCPC